MSEVEKLRKSMEENWKSRTAMKPHDHVKTKKKINSSSLWENNQIYFSVYMFGIYYGYQIN